MESLKINADNSVTIDKLVDSAAPTTYLNSGVTCTFTLYRETVVDGVMTSGSAVLTSATGVFAASDVGRSIVVSRAGAHGSDLRTTVLSFQSATQITLSATAGTTVSDAVVEMSLPNAKDVSMSYVSASDGKYRGILDNAVSLADGQSYLLEATIDAGSGRNDFRRIRVPANYREDD